SPELPNGLQRMDESGYFISSALRPGILPPHRELRHVLHEFLWASARSVLCSEFRLGRGRGRLSLAPQEPTCSASCQPFLCSIRLTSCWVDNEVRPRQTPNRQCCRA